MSTTTPRPIRNPDTRVRLLRRAAAVIDAAPILERKGIAGRDPAAHAADRLAARGLAITTPRLLEYAYHLRTHRAIEDGTEDPLDLLDEDASYVDADATRAALAREFEARVHCDERFIAGVTRPL
jgi:hypothetical protein